MKKKTTKNNSEKSFEFGQVMTMLEQMNDGIGVIAEAQGETNNRLGNLEKKADGIDKRLINVEGNVIAINERLIRVEDDVIEIKHKLSEKVDRDEFNKMEKRMIKLEKLVFAKLG
jgi:predicted nuclease with TOPRIM domain